MKKVFTAALSAAALLASTAARADVIIYVGYYDLAPSSSYSNPNTLPDPWVGSANTTFLGDTSYATSSDPDESALRIQNTGATAVTINPGLMIGGYQLWDTLIGSGFVLGAGQNVIFGATNGDNFDGSDQSMTQAISVGINGSSHNFTDSNNVLVGYPEYDETISWQQIGKVSFESGVPEAATWAMMIAGMAMVGASLRRRKTIASFA